MKQHYMTPKEVAELKQVNVRTVYRAIRRGDLAAKETVRGYQVDPQSVAAWQVGAPGGRTRQQVTYVAIFQTPVLGHWEVLAAGHNKDDVLVAASKITLGLSPGYAAAALQTTKVVSKTEARVLYGYDFDQDDPKPEARFYQWTG